MSGECDQCGEHALECQCDAKLQFALSALNLAFTTIASLGYLLPQKIEFVKDKRKEDGMD